MKRSPRIQKNCIVNRLLLVKRENTVSIMHADRVQLTQHQIVKRWMGPDGPVILTKDYTASVLRKKERFLTQTFGTKKKLHELKRHYRT